MSHTPKCPSKSQPADVVCKPFVVVPVPQRPKSGLANNPALFQKSSCSQRGGAFVRWATRTLQQWDLLRVLCLCRVSCSVFVSCSMFVSHGLAPRLSSDCFGRAGQDLVSRTCLFWRAVATQLITTWLEHWTGESQCQKLMRGTTTAGRRTTQQPRPRCYRQKYVLEIKAVAEAPNLKNGALKLKNEAFLRDFLENWSFEDQKWRFSWRLLQNCHVERTLEFQYILTIFMWTLQKYCACHEKVEPRHTKSCNCHAKWVTLPWHEICNLSTVWASEASPIDITEREIIVPATQNALFQTLFKFPTPANVFATLTNSCACHVFCNVSKSLRLWRFKVCFAWQAQEFRHVAREGCKNVGRRGGFEKAPKRCFSRGRHKDFVLCDVDVWNIRLWVRGRVAKYMSRKSFFAGPISRGSYRSSYVSAQLFCSRRFLRIQLKIFRTYCNSEVKCLVDISFLKEVSFFEFQSFNFEGSLAEKLRFSIFTASILKEVLQKSSVFELSRAPSVLTVLTFKSLLRAGVVQILRTSTSKSAPSMPRFNDFDFQIALARRRGANFVEVTFQKCSDTASF